MYEDLENDAPVAPNAPNATTNIEGKENEIGSRKRQGTRQIAVGNRSGNAGVLKAAGGKGKLETRQSAKDRPASITALKLIAKQGADEKAELEQWKEDFVARIACEMTQLRETHEETMQAQYREMENQRVSFTIEIEALKKEINELKRSEEENKGTPTMGKNQAQPTRERKSLENLAEPIEEEIRHSPSPNQENKGNTPAPHISPAKIHQNEIMHRSLLPLSLIQQKAQQKTVGQKSLMENGSRALYQPLQN